MLITVNLLEAQQLIRNVGYVTHIKADVPGRFVSKRL